MFTVNVGDVFSPFDKNFQNSMMLNNRSARFQHNSDPRMRDTGVEAQQLLIFRNENEQELIATITFIRTDADIGWEIINDGGFGSSSTGVLKAKERKDLNLDIEKLVPVPEEIRDQILGCYDTFVALCDSVEMSIKNLKNQTLEERDKKMFIAALRSGDQNFFPQGHKDFAAKVFTPENRADWFRNALLNQSQRT